MPSSTAVLTGFYRYSDIQFEWHQVLQDASDRSALKAFVSYQAIVDPNHPLRLEGVDGIELYMGTLQTGQSRLMFSSAQIEYARYWLYQMGLTKTMLPIPSSDYLLTESSLRNWSPVVYKTAEDMKKALRIVDKNNKRLKGTDSTLLSFRQIFERVRTFWGARNGTWLAVDFEAWEMEHAMMTEFGWSSVQWANGQEVLSDGHIRVKEYDSFRNGKYVPDERESYKFGTSEIISKAACKQRIHDLIAKYTKAGPLFLVFHDSSQDIRSLNAVEAPIKGFTFLLPDIPPSEGIFIVDTSELFSALEGDVSQRRTLERACRMLKISTQCLHNAGNDAHYTLQALRAMASGNQVDIQREDRWPNATEPSATGTGLKVNFPEWMEESDYSDTEGLFGLTKNMSLDQGEDGV